MEDSNDATEPNRPDQGIGDPAKLFEGGRDDRGRFKRGPNPDCGVRPRGARNKLAEQFLLDLHELWAEQGESVLRRAAFESPMKFADMIARLLPAKIEIKDTTGLDAELGALSYEQEERLLGALRTLRQQLQESEEAAEREIVEYAKLIDVTPATPVVDPANKGGGDGDR